MAKDRVMDIDTRVRLDDALSDAYAKAEGVRQILASLGSSMSADCTIGRQGFDVLAEAQLSAVSAIKDAFDLFADASELDGLY